MVEGLAISSFTIATGACAPPGCKAASMPPISTSAIDISNWPVAIANPTRALIKEKIIAFLRNEVQIVVDDIEDHAPLSHLGIDSLGIASIHCELEQATRKRVNPDAVYALDTIAELADYLDS